MAIKKNDFIELEFTAKVKDTNEVFDTNVKEEAKKEGLDEKAVTPLIIAVGKAMTLKGLDDVLEGKEVGKQYVQELTPEQSFGKRDSKMVRMIPLKVFIEQKIMPERGMQLSLDGMLVKILSVSGGRVLVDFNHPIAGKNVIYTYTIKRVVDDMKEKINSLQEVYFRNKFEFYLDEQKKEVTFKVPSQFTQFLQLFEKQFNDALGLKILFKEPEKKVDEKKDVKVEKKDVVEEKK